MTYWTRVQGWRRRRKRQKAARKLDAPLREFVYLDDVSVYSLLASRLGPIATEFTNTETVSLNSEIGSSLGGSFGIAKAGVNSRVETGHTHGSQVLRKSIVQTAFKELYELEQDSLALRPMVDESAPAETMLSALEATVDSGTHKPWVIDPEQLRRGILVEAEVELETEPIFRVSAVITTILKIMEENVHLFGTDHASQTSDIRSVGRVLESLLAGLVPIRGRLIDYKAMEIRGQDMLVHRSAIEQLKADQQTVTRPVFVVGVAERSLFWKDIRRVLFSGSTYRVFCRISNGGLASEWRPVKLVDVLNEVNPLLGQQVSDIGDTALLAMEDAVAGSGATVSRNEDQQRAAIEQYAMLLAEHHGKELSPDAINSLETGLTNEGDWLDTVDKRRLVFSELTRRIDELIGVETSRDLAATYRVAAVADIGLGLGGTLAPSPPAGSPRQETPRDERFLDAEIVAIYW